MPEARHAQLTTTFRERFSGEPTLGVRAPGRVDLMGSHTDYHQGFVLTLSIDRDTWIAARAHADRCVRLYSLNLDESVAFDLDEPAASTQGFGRYVQGVGTRSRAFGQGSNGTAD